jgi:serpin B
MLPKATLSAFLNQLTQATWNSWMKSFSEMEGTVLLPKFKIEYKTSLKNTLLALGMVPAFSSETANFSRMRKQKDVFISDVIHKTFIDVNEKGTEAAAATAVVMMKTSMAEPKKTFLMEVNKPFFFAITDTTSNEILFMGVINNPAM